MASWQDIRELEERIYEEVEEYMNNPEAYNDAVLHVYHLLNFRFGNIENC